MLPLYTALCKENTVILKDRNSAFERVSNDVDERAVRFSNKCVVMA